MGSGMTIPGLWFHPCKTEGKLFDLTPGRFNSYAPSKRPFPYDYPSIRQPRTGSPGSEALASWVRRATQVPAADACPEHRSIGGRFFRGDDPFRGFLENEPYKRRRMRQSRTIVHIGSSRNPTTFSRHIRVHHDRWWSHLEVNSARQLVSNRDPGTPEEVRNRTLCIDSLRFNRHTFYFGDISSATNFGVSSEARNFLHKSEAPNRQRSENRLSILRSISRRVDGVIEKRWRGDGVKLGL